MQKMKFPFEILVSDDNSFDGTCEVVEKYMACFPRIIRLFHISSDDYNPTISSERSGINKANVYSKACGKYVVNIDADDYLLSDDIYAKQVELLERNPDCWLCMQDIMMLDDNGNVKSIWGHQGLHNEDRIDFRTYILERHMISNPAFMMRRDKDLDPISTYGKMFNDEYITMHHLQKGDIVYIYRSDYGYVQYPGSIDHSYKGQSRLARYALLPLIYCRFFPKYEYVFLKGYLPMLISNFKQLGKIKDLQVSQQVKDFLKQFDGYMFNCLSSSARIGIQQRVRIKIVLYYMLALSFFHVSRRSAYKCLRLLMER